MLPHIVSEYQDKNPSTFNFTKEWKSNMEIAKAYLEKVVSRMKKWAYKGRRPLKFNVRDMVMVTLTQEQFCCLWDRDLRLIRKYEGPMPIVAKVRRALYTMVTQERMKVQLVFHVKNSSHITHIIKIQHVTTKPKLTLTSNYWRRWRKQRRS